MENLSINGFVLKYKLGDGGMAEVWYAENYLQKPAAVKVLLRRFCEEPEIVSRFENEAKLMVQLNHQHIRNIQDYGTINGRPCMVMEYLEGKDLAARMNDGEIFDKGQLITWWNDLVDALQYTHRKNIIHRDVKPSNLFVTEDGKIKVLDFGIAKIKDNITVTQTGSRMGTLMYMSPEQVYDVKNLTHKTDAYSLAVTFYHLVTGKAPYDHTKISDFEIQESIVRKNIDTSVLQQPWRNLLPLYFYKNAADRRELQKISNDVAQHDETIAIHPINNPAPIPQQNFIYPPQKQRPSRFPYVLLSLVILLGVVVFALNKEKISGIFNEKNEVQTSTGNKKSNKKPVQEKPAPIIVNDTPVTQPDTITTEGDGGNIDQVVVSVDLREKEANLKSEINDYYTTRNDCDNLSHFFADTVKQYYKKSNESLAKIQKECEAYHSKWKFTEADINPDSWVFTHNQNGKVYIDFTMLYKIKQNADEDWIPYNIDVAMVVAENNKIERIVERRIEKL